MQFFLFPLVLMFSLFVMMLDFAVFILDLIVAAILIVLELFVFLPFKIIKEGINAMRSETFSFVDQNGKTITITEEDYKSNRDLFDPIIKNLDVKLPKWIDKYIDRKE